MSKRKILLEELTPLSLQEILDGETFSTDEVENIRLRRNKNIPNKCIRCLYDNYDNDNVKMTKQYVTDAIGELEGRGNGIRYDQEEQGMEKEIE